MRTLRHMLVVLILVPAAIALQACGSDDASTATTAQGDTLLNVTLWPQGPDAPGGVSPETLVVRCDPADDSADCAALRDLPEEVLDRPVQTDVCTQVYGGPEIAEVDGVIEGVPVQMSLSREDGCEIARWDAVMPLLSRIAARGMDDG